MFWSFKIPRDFLNNLIILSLKTRVAPPEPRVIFSWISSVFSWARKTIPFRRKHTITRPYFHLSRPHPPQGIYKQKVITPSKPLQQEYHAFQAHRPRLLQLGWWVLTRRVRSSRAPSATERVCEDLHAHAIAAAANNARRNQETLSKTSNRHFRNQPDLKILNPKISKRDCRFRNQGRLPNS